MSLGSMFTPESIHAMAQEAKEFVRYCNWSMGNLLNLCIEEVDAEYSDSPEEGNRLLAELCLTRDHYHEDTSLSGGWEEAFIRSIAGPFTHPSYVASLVATALRFPVDLDGDKCWFDDASLVSLLHNCAHRPDFRLIADCRLGDWKREPIKSFRTGFEAAAFFGYQVRDYGHRIYRLDWLSSVPRAVSSFPEFLDACRLERDRAIEHLRPCICTDQLGAIIDYEAAWLLHACCAEPAPRQFDFPSPMRLTAEIQTTQVLCKAYYPGQLAKRIDCDDDTLVKYAVEYAKLEKRSIGEKDKSYSGMEVQKICEAFLEKSRVEKHKRAATEILNGG